MVTHPQRMYVQLSPWLHILKGSMSNCLRANMSSKEVCPTVSMVTRPQRKYVQLSPW